MFILIEIGFWFEKYQWHQEGQGNFLILKFAGKQFLKWFKDEKTANLSQNFPKMAIRKFYNFDSRRFKQKRLYTK